MVSNTSMMEKLWETVESFLMGKIFGSGYGIT